MTIAQKFEENARLVLQIYSHFGRQPGEALLANNFLAVAARRRIPVSDIQRGLDHASEVGWIEKAENGSLRLTRRGYEAMQQPDRSH